MIERIKTMEEKYDKAISAVENLDAAMEQFKSIIPDIEELIAYYESELWRSDFEEDQKGNLPNDLKRGILSEDGMYDLLTDYARLVNLLKTSC